MYFSRSSVFIPSFIFFDKIAVVNEKAKEFAAAKYISSSRLTEYLYIEIT